MGIPALSAHLLVFWVSVQSGVTPPVALASWAAAAIAKSDPWKTGLASMKLASWIYLMPFMFIYTPILNVGWNFAFIWTVVTAVIALVAWAAALEGYWFRTTVLWERAALFVAAFGLLHSGLLTDAVGIGLMVAVALSQKVFLKKEALLGGITMNKDRRCSVPGSDVGTGEPRFRKIGHFVNQGKMEDNMKSTGKRFGRYVLAGILLIALTAVQTAAAAEAKRYIMGSGRWEAPGRSASAPACN